MALYYYNVIVTKVYDGDTMTVDIDLGFNAWLRNQKLRLANIDTPEIRTKDPIEKAEGYKARDFAREFVNTAKQVLIHSKGKGKYGRWIVDIYKDDLKTSLNDLLVQEDLAEYVKY